MAVATRFDLGFLAGVSLQKPIELFLVAPGAAVVVEFQRAAGDVADDRIMPAGQLDSQSFYRAAEKLHCLSDSRWQPKPLTGGQDSRRIANLSLNRDNMRQVVFSFPWWL